MAYGENKWRVMLSNKYRWDSNDVRAVPKWTGPASQTYLGQNVLRGLIKTCHLIMLETALNPSHAPIFSRHVDHLQTTFSGHEPHTVET